MASRVHIGPAGWSYPDWNGIVYPAGRFDHLEFLSSYFNLIEINSTFYRIPERSTCRRWAERVVGNPDFLFTVKAFQGFTHQKTPASKSDIEIFKDAVSPIHEAGRLAAVLVQFPWSFRFSQDALGYVGHLSEWFSPMPIAVEVRHGGWSSENAVSFFRENRLTMCAIDQPRIGDSLGPDTYVVGDAGAYVRLHGRNYKEWFKADTNRDARYDYFYSENEMGDWADRITRFSQESPKVNVVMNNHFRGQAVANALELRAKISRERPTAPLGVVQHFPRLRDVLEPDDRWAKPRSKNPRQGSLFEQDENQ